MKRPTRATWPAVRADALGAMWRALGACCPPARATAHFHQGNLCHARGLQDAALQHWRLAAEGAVPHARALLNLAQAQAQARRWAEAAAAYRTLYDGQPDADHAYRAGQCHLALGQREHAEADFHRCIACNATHVGALEHLGRLALARRDGTAARNWLERALAGAHDPDALHFLLGAACELTRERADALAHYRAVRSGPLTERAGDRIRGLTKAAAAADDFTRRSHGTV